MSTEIKRKNYAQTEENLHKYCRENTNVRINFELQI